MGNLAMPIAFTRRFQLWSYSVSHSVLLLRSNIRPGIDSRVDLMFRAVTAMKLRNRYEDLEIDVVPLAQICEADQELIGDLRGRFIFRMREAQGHPGFVVAGSMYLSEDSLSDSDPNSIENRDLESKVIYSGQYT